MTGLSMCEKILYNIIELFQLTLTMKSAGTERRSLLINDSWQYGRIMAMSKCLHCHHFALTICGVLVRSSTS